MKKELFLLVILILLPLASAKIVFTNSPEKIYNVGDVIETEFLVQPEIPISGFVESYLNCENDRILFFKEFRDFSSDNEQTFQLALPASSKGNCTIESKFQNEKEDSNIFEISEEIEVNLNLNNNVFAPSEKLSLNGTAIKKNSKNLDGLVKIQIGNFSNNTLSVNKGNFDFNLEIPKLTPPGNYTLNAFAYEINSDGEKINFGDITKHFEIKSWPTKIEINSEESLKPSGKLSFNAKLLNQVSEHLNNETIIVKIFDPYNNLVYEEAKKSGSNLEFYFETNSTKGAWKINGFYGNIFTEKQIYIQENRQVDFYFENDSDSVRVRNVGNVPYEGVMEIFAENALSNITLALNLNLSIGESALYPLDLEGEYNFSNSEEEFGNYYISKPSITGAVISSGLKKGLIGILFIILVLVFGAYFLIKKYKKIPKKEKIISSKIVPPKTSPEKSSLYEKNLVPEIKQEKPKTHLENQEEKKSSNKKIYSLFFNSTNQDIHSLIKSRKYDVHTMGLDYYFVLIPSEENIETSLLRLAKEIKMKNPRVGIILNSNDFDKGLSSIRESFIPKEIMKNTLGIFVTESFFKNLKKPISSAFTEDKSFKLKERIIKLFYFHI